MEKESFIVVSNHIKPKSKILQNLAISPDAFQIRKVFERKFSSPLKIVAKCDNGWWAKNKFFCRLQKTMQPVSEKIYSFLGFIPIRKNPGSFNKIFLEAVKKAVSKRESILIFPEGDWYEDNERNFIDFHTLELGSAYLARKFELKILPVAISGVTVKIGSPFLSLSSKKEIIERIKKEIEILQRSLK